MDLQDILGLMMAMVALGGTVVEHVGPFILDLDQQYRDKVCGFFESQLSVLYSDKEVCRWLAWNTNQLNKELINFARHLGEKRVERSYDILQMTRVCGEYQDHQRYISTCDMLLRSA